MWGVLTCAGDISEQYCTVHGNCCALNCNLYLKLFICSFSLQSLVLPTSLDWFFLSLLLLLCYQAQKVTVSVGSALQSHVASTRSKSRRKGRWKSGLALGLCPLSGVLLLTQLTAMKKREWGGVGCEWPKCWQGCWQEGDAGLLTCLGQTLIQGEAWRWLVWAGKELLYQEC